MYPILSILDFPTTLLCKLSNLDFNNTSLAYLKSSIFYYSASKVLAPSLEVKALISKLSGTGAYLSLFLFFIDISTQSGMPSHSSVETFANYLFKSTNLLVIELSA